jgi:hypothetical protein
VRAEAHRVFLSEEDMGTRLIRVISLRIRLSSKTSSQASTGQFVGERVHDTWWYRNSTHQKMLEQSTSKESSQVFPLNVERPLRRKIQSPTRGRNHNQIRHCPPTMLIFTIPSSVIGPETARTVWLLFGHLFSGLSFFFHNWLFLGG